MACFIVPMTEAAVTTVVNKVVRSHEKKETKSESGESLELHTDVDCKIPFSRKISWLSNMLWGGSALLAFEHVWHGEVVPWAPFLTAAVNPADTADMLHEMSTVGVAMAVLVTAVWGGMVLVSHVLEKKQATEKNQTSKEVQTEQ